MENRDTTPKQPHTPPFTGDPWNAGPPGPAMRGASPAQRSGPQGPHGCWDTRAARPGLPSRRRRCGRRDTLGIVPGVSLRLLAPAAHIWVSSGPGGPVPALAGGTNRGSTGHGWKRGRPGSDCGDVDVSLVSLTYPCQGYSQGYIVSAGQSTFPQRCIPCIPDFHQKTVGGLRQGCRGCCGSAGRSVGKVRDTRDTRDTFLQKPILTCDDRA